jgi:hypothetical protein
VPILQQQRRLTSPGRWNTSLPFAPSLWPCITPNLRHLELALGPNPRNSTDLDGITQLSSLRSLKLTNFSESFQAVLWETCWRCAELQSLELRARGMPILRGEVAKTWRSIDRTWVMRPLEDRIPGHGNL